MKLGYLTLAIFCAGLLCAGGARDRVASAGTSLTVDFSGIVPDGAAARDTAGKTFTRDIAPIFQQKCQECHHAGGIAPMALVNYEDARPWARSIREKVITKDMPPFNATGPIGYFKEDPRLTPEEVTTITTWVDSGAPKGDPADQPAARSWPNDWEMGAPDMVLSMKRPYSIKGNRVDDYELFVFDQTFPEDTWIRGMEFHPGNRRAVHHASLYILPDDLPPADTDGRVEGADLFVHGGTLYGVWVPGSGPRRYEDGFAAMIPKGTRFGIQIHYAPTEEPMTDQTSVGIYLANGPIHKVNQMIYGGTDRIDIPAGAPAYQLTEFKRFKTDAIVKAFTVHMHLRGKSAVVRLRYPDGTSETIFEVPRFNFYWQRFYRLAKPLAIPKGTVAEFIATYDNSAANKYNPNPAQVVHFGEKTSDEMMSMNIQYEIPGQDLKLWARNGRLVADPGQAALQH